MSGELSLRVVPIVEGHGEVEAVGTLLRRIASEICGVPNIWIERPIRIPRTRLVKAEELPKAVRLAAMKLRQASQDESRSLILLLLDADEDLPCELAPELLVIASRTRPDIDVSCVLANVEYETWFVAAAASLDKYLHLPELVDLPDQPEEQRAGKAWIQQRWRGPRYSETVDQAKLTAVMDLDQCRQRSPSFDKLCRELEARLD